MVDFRVGLYKKLLKAGYSILAFDYRGFADSTEITDITETTVVHDSHIALHYVRWVHIACLIGKEQLVDISSLQKGAWTEKSLGVGSLHGFWHLCPHDGHCRPLQV